MFLEIVPPGFHLANQFAEVASKLPGSAELIRPGDLPPDFNFEVVPVSDVLTAHEIRRDDESQGVPPFLGLGNHVARLYVRLYLVCLGDGRNSSQRWTRGRDGRVAGFPLGARGGLERRPMARLALQLLYAELRAGGGEPSQFIECLF